MNTVKRGAGRPAATARTSKHAQRTPLPPKPGVIESAREIIAETASVESPAPAVPTRTEEPEETSEPGGTKSWAKAMAFRDAVRKLGWSTSIGHPQDGAEIDLVEVLAQRGVEYLYISWRAGGLQHPVTYTINDRTVKMRNASQAKQYAARSAEVAEQELSKVVSNKAFRKREVEPKRARLPFDPGLATNEEVVTALLGKSVAWHNRISQGTEVATLGRDAKRIRVEERDGGERIVLFCCPSTGFRAFRLSALMRVGGGKRYVVRDRDGQRADVEELPEEVTAS